ncbi:MAG: hypothetical protein MUO43_03170 [Desulfobacterales bacterium]|nr:hypothetical protein [Desulfobacterales bacterium]
MDINGVSTQIPQVILPELPNNEEPDLNGISKEQLENNGISQTQSTQTQPVNQEVVKNEKVKGVIRLLQEGHFKGVADVRLRINFFEELSAMENGEIQKVAGENVPAITDSVNANLEDLLSFDNLSEEQATSISKQTETFTQSVDLMKEDFLNAAQPSKEDLISGLNSSFEEFIASLNLVLLPPETELPETESLDDNSTNEDPGIDELITANAAVRENDEIIEPDQAVGPETIFQNFIKKLRITFAESLNELTTALNNTKILPDLSEPNGNGKAYDKFVTIYNNLQGIDAHDHNSTDRISVIA